MLKQDKAVRYRSYADPFVRPALPRGGRGFLLLSLVLAFFIPPPPQSSDKKSSREDSQFEIYVAGKEIGKEKYSILSSNDSAGSSSALEFHDPGGKNQSVRIETQLNMDNRFLPRTYRLSSNVDGQKGAILGTFSQGQVIFEFKGNGVPRKNGLLVGDRYTVLDTNVFHHFVFIARLFDFDKKDKPQSFEVVVPQELENGILKIINAGKETIQTHGKKRQVYHLRADSGMLRIDLWVDEHRILHKIALPSKGIEVIRSP